MVKLTRKQAIGTVYTVTGDILLSFQGTTRDSKGNHLTLFKVLRPTGEEDTDRYITSEINDKWFVPQSPATDLLRAQEKNRLIKAAVREKRRRAWYRAVERALEKIGMNDATFVIYHQDDGSPYLGYKTRDARSPPYTVKAIDEALGGLGKAKRDSFFGFRIDPAKLPA